MFKKVLVVFGIILFLGFVGLLSAQDDVMFNYQGRVKVQGNLFTGSGQFKFVIINNAGNESLWSNDNTSAGGGEPIASISISVTEGIFNAMIGDTGLGMSAINRSIFNNPDQIKLRIWFSDGTYGFQQLLPDHKLANVDLLGMSTGSTDFMIYVNGSSGNNTHNGLSASKAKKTIQAAVDVLPERIKCNVTIDVADGTYMEEVKIYGITVEPGKTLKILGDDSWTPASPGDPAVRITGTDNLVTPVITRNTGIYVTNVMGLEVVGFKIDYAVKGIMIANSSLKVRKCKLSSNNTGLHTDKTTVLVYDTLSEYSQGTIPNNGWGMGFSNNSHGELFRCILQNNNGHGLWAHNLSSVSVSESGKFSNNSSRGVVISSLSRVIFISGYSGEIKNNTGNGIYCIEHSFVGNYSLNTISGNAVPEVNTATGGGAY